MSRIHRRGAKIKTVRPSLEVLEDRVQPSTVSWINSASGQWSTGTNWSTGAVPGAGDDVVINQSNTVTVTLAAGTSIHSLSVTGATLNVTGGTLAVAADSSNAGSLQVQPGAHVTFAGNYFQSAAGSLTLPAAGLTTGVGANLLSNNGFESPSGTTAAPNGWPSWGTSNVNTQYAHTGSQSLQESGPNSGVLESFSVTPGVSYTGMVYAMTPASNKLTGPEGGFLQVIFYDAGGNQISPYSPPNSVTILTSNSSAGGPIAGSVGNQGWNFFSTTAVAPANAAKVNFVLETGAYTGLSGTAGGAVFWDDPQFGPTAANSASLSAASMTNNGTISIGAADKVGVSGAFTQSSIGILTIQLGGPPASLLYGSLIATGAATLAGTLQATLVNGYSPAVSDGFNALTYSSVTGTFATYQLPSGAGYNFATAVSPTYVGFSAVPTQLSTTVNAGTVVGPVATNMLGVNLAWWDDKLTTTKTQDMVRAAGLTAFRLPGGSSSDDFHFNVSNNFGDSVAVTIPQFAQFVENVGGVGLVTLDYGSGSPQEAAAELAYLEGSPTDTTIIGNGLEWNDSTNQWQSVNWQTVGYWASLRAATPLPQNDGYNFLRINHAAVFTQIRYWEVGNEEYGSWETDHHGTAGPGGVSTGTQRDPATYAAFAHTFAVYAAEIDPGISIGIDSGDPGSGYNNWTKNVLTQGQSIGFIPGFISDHSYMQGPGQESDSTLLLHTVSDPNSILDWSVRHADYQSMLQTTLGNQASSVQVMATEFNSVYTNPGKQSTSLVNGLFIADSIGSLLDSGYTGGFVWDLRNGWDTSQNNSPSLYGWRQGGDYGLLGDPNTSSPPSTGPYVPYPNYFAEQLASKIVLAGGLVVSASSNYQNLAAYAVLEANGHLELLVINKNPDADLNEQFTVQGFTPNDQAQVWQYGEAQDYAQSKTSDGSAALTNFTTTLALNGSSFNYTFPAYSMTVLDLTPATIPTHFAISSPSGATAGSAFSFAVTAEDQFNNTVFDYNGTVHFTSSDGQAILPANSTLTNGTGTFSATLKTAGNQTISATDTVSSSITGTSSPIQVQAATATHIFVSAPASATAGASFSFTVTPQDQFNNTATSYSGTVHFTSSAAKAVLPANYTFTTADAGVHTFAATLRSAGSQSITTADTATPTIFGSSQSIAISPAATDHLILSQFPSKTTAGVGHNLRITAQDLYGNATPAFADTVTFSSTDSQALLPASYAFGSGDMGVHNFSATLNTAGTQSIRVQDLSHANIPTAKMSGITVTPAAASRLQVSGFPSSVLTGTAHNFTVTALDAYGNVATAYLGTVGFTSTDSQSALPGNYSFASGDGGVHTFSATLNTGGSNQTITAADTANAGITGSESGISVVSSQPTASVSDPSPAIGVPGQPLIFTLSANESGTATTFTYSIDWGDGSARQTLPGEDGSAIMATHIFTALGSFTVSVTAADASGNVSLTSSAPSVSISTVAMEPDPLNSNQTALYVGGTTGNDTIAITPVAGGGIKIGMNFVNYGSFFPSRVVVYGQAGADIIKTAPQTLSGVLTYVTVPVMFFSGSGNDILNLSGSDGNTNNVLVGGGGADRLIGGQGRDILIGGAGQATLQAGGGGDILVGGTTAFDNNSAALAAILAEWSRTDIDYVTRIAHLTGGLGGGLNGNEFLNANTVSTNNLADSLYGGAGMDWFFAGMLDVITNNASGEMVTQI
jgi:hypothetical protein